MVLNEVYSVHHSCKSKNTCIRRNWKLVTRGTGVQVRDGRKTYFFSPETLVYPFYLYGSVILPFEFWENTHLLPSGGRGGYFHLRNGWNFRTWPSQGPSVVTTLPIFQARLGADGRPVPALDNWTSEDWPLEMRSTAHLCTDTPPPQPLPGYLATRTQLRIRTFFMDSEVLSQMSLKLIRFFHPHSEPVFPLWGLIWPHRIGVEFYFKPKTFEMLQMRKEAFRELPLSDLKTDCFGEWSPRKFPSPGRRAVTLTRWEIA